MAYRKILIDNTTCSRRFHLTYDDENANQPRTEIKCPHCQVTIFAEENHPEVRFAREENLTQTMRLSEELISECAFEDQLSLKTIPPDLLKRAQAKGGQSS